MFLEAAVKDIAKYKTFILQICGGTKERRQIFFFFFRPYGMSKEK